MRAARPVLSALLALVLLAQTGWAAAHCLAMAAPAGHAVEICSPDGIRTIRVSDDGTALPETAPHAGDGFCAACPLSDAPALPAPPILAGPAWTVSDAAPYAGRAPAFRPPPRAPPYAQRAPPTFA